MGSSVNTINPNVDLTVRVFDSFYTFDANVPANEYDTVNSYFLSVFNDKTAAKNFTTAMFRVAFESQIPILTLLQEIATPDKVQLTSTIAYYLNGLRSPCTMLGVSSTTAPNVFAARNVLP